jgi:hypothetical protein
MIKTVDACSICVAATAAVAASKTSWLFTGHHGILTATQAV